MTFSIVARSADGAAHGVAVASKFLAVGAAVPAAEARRRARSRPSRTPTSPTGRRGWPCCAPGCPRPAWSPGLTAADDGRDQRQVGVVGAAGDGATFTGDDCHAWAGGVAGDGYAIQGNILTGPEVVAAMEAAWLAGRRTSRAWPVRLLAALRAGDGAGGDRRGRQSAALLVVAKGRGTAAPATCVVDLRVDDHPDPVAELARLLDVHDAAASAGRTRRRCST